MEITLYNNGLYRLMSKGELYHLERYDRFSREWKLRELFASDLGKRARAVYFSSSRVG